MQVVKRKLTNLDKSPPPPTHTHTHTHIHTLSYHKILIPSLFVPSTIISKKISITIEFLLPFSKLISSLFNYFLNGFLLFLLPTGDSSNLNKCRSEANGLTKTLRDRFKVFSDDLSHSECLNANKQI